MPSLKALLMARPSFQHLILNSKKEFCLFLFVGFSGHVTAMPSCRLSFPWQPSCRLSFPRQPGGFVMPKVDNTYSSGTAKVSFDFNVPVNLSGSYFHKVSLDHRS